MIALIVILTIVSTLLIITLGALWFLLKLVDRILANDELPQPIEIFEGKGIILAQFNAEYEGIIYDFSKYEDYGIIGITAMNMGDPKNHKEKLVDGIPVFKEDVTVVRFSDGSMSLC